MHRLFPTVSGSPARHLNLDWAARIWAGASPDWIRKGENPLVNATECQRFIDALHRSLEVSWSWGGYLENRSFLWRGSYLDQTGGYIHAGVDLNLPAGTEIAAPCDLVVEHIDDDSPENWGWGPRMFVRPLSTLAESAAAVIFVFAHLANIRITAGESVKAGTILAEIGRPPLNGNWYEHLHLQALRQDSYEAYKKAGFQLLDGYFHFRDIKHYKMIFPEPLSLLGLI